MSETESSLKTRLLAAFIESDDISRKERVERTLWLGQHREAYGLVSGPMDTLQAIDEAGGSFVHGYYVASLLLAMAVIEHLITDALIDQGLAKHGITLAAAIAKANECELFPSEMLVNAERLRQIRNPFVHRKALGHEHTFGNRFKRAKTHFRSILEQDAKDALSLMYRLYDRALRSG